MANIEALEQVVRVLEKVADDGKPFDLTFWVNKVYEEREVREKGWFGRETVRFEQHQCGTGGCAIGWAACDPWFTARGFRLGNSNRLNGQVPLYQGAEDWGAVRKFFDISLGDAKLMFAASAYIGKTGPLEVAGRIRMWIDSHATAGLCEPQVTKPNTD